jgi:rhodanese-related sulfurtransferase
MPLGSTANRHGRVIGDNVTGGSSTFPGITRTTVFKVLDYNVGKTGLNEREAKEAGYDPVVCMVPKIDISHYLPSVSSFTIKLIADRKIGKLLGGQILGHGEVVKRIDILATALRFRASLRDVADLDLGYAPLYSTAIDPIAHATNVVRNKIDDLARGILAEELKKKLDDGDDLILLDVRMPEEIARISFKDPRLRLIPVAQLRRRYEELPENSEIVIVCATGFRAYEAQRFLNGRNYKDVKFLEGGISAWPYQL